MENDKKRHDSRSHTYHHLSAAAESLPVVVCSNHIKFKVGAPHVPVHDGCLNYACEGLNNKAVFAVSSRGDNQPIQHGTEIPCVLIQSLSETIEQTCQRGIATSYLSPTTQSCLTSAITRHSTFGP